MAPAPLAQGAAGQDAMHAANHLRGPSQASLANFAAYSWNVFRYFGDLLHLGGVGVLLLTIAKNKSVSGISRSTQVLYFLVFITRYLDLLERSQTTYLVFFKLTYIISSVGVLILFRLLDTTYERRHDTCNLTAIVMPCAVAALLLANEHHPLEVLWTFSQFIEGFAMVPQYVFCYRDSGKPDWGASLYVVMLGGYRVFYALNWIYKKVHMPHYSDIQSWIGGLIEICFFVDFLNYRFTGKSMLRSMVLAVDTKINEISNRVEMKVRGSSSRQEGAIEGCEMRRRRKPQEEQPMEDV